MRRRPARGRWRGGRLLAGALLAGALLGLPAGPRPAAGGPDPAAPPEGLPVLARGAFGCRDCRIPDGAPVDTLDRAAIRALGDRMTAHNLALLARTDSLYAAGFFGPRGGSARRAARLHCMLRARNGVDYLDELSGAPAWSVTDERALYEPFGEEFANCAVYPLRFLLRAQTGGRTFCLEYDTSAEFDERVRIGGMPVRVRSDRVTLDGEAAVTPVLSVEVLSRMHKALDMVYRDRFCGRVDRETIVDRGDTLELITMRDVEGMYVRKAGLHRLNAIVAWRSVVHGDRDPDRPRVGACAYFPCIQVKLSLLPDFGLEDLRTFDYPQPVVGTAWAARGPRTDWLRVDAGGLFRDWNQAGPRPLVVEERYPDL